MKKVFTDAGIEVKPLYTAADLPPAEANLPGQFPFTRGVQANMYRGRLWTMRQYAGFSTAELSNQRYHYLLSQGVSGLSVAFDLPTQIGYDSDHALAEGEVGKVGVAIDCLSDMQALFKGITLQQVSTSVGTGGGGLGYLGITPSLAVEFDTWQNTGMGDPSFDHMAIMRNGVTDHTLNSNLAGPVTMLPGAPNVEDCQWHLVRVTWSPLTNQLQVYFDCQLRLTYTGNIRQTIFNNTSNVFWGFTGATGGSRNRHAFCLDYVSFTQFDQEVSICRGGATQIDVGSGLYF
ncbi:MAG: hypothetical protein EAY75_09100, partial [Bacteroidetes bacterium]